MFKKRFDYIDFRLGDACDGIDALHELIKKTINNAKIWAISIKNEIDQILAELSEKNKEFKNIHNYLIKTVDAVIDIQGIVYNLDDNVSDIKKEAEAIRETELSAYEDIVKLSAENKKFKTKIEDIISRMESHCKSVEYITSIEQENKKLIKENESLRIRNIELEKLEKKMLSEVNSLADSFAMVAQGIYNQENIEFAAVKTYRDGWKYICYNGRQLTNFDDVESLRIDYYIGERLKMDIEFK